MRIVYWARVPFVQATLQPLLEAERGIDLTIVTTLDDLAEALPGADGLICIDCSLELAPRVRELLHAPSTSLRWLHVLSAGREGFIAADVPAAVTITGPAGAHSPVLAEHTLALMLAWTRRTPDFARATREHRWAREVVPLMTSLEGQTLAIVGLGHVGHELAKRARAFGMHVIATNRTPKADPFVAEVFPLTQLHDVLGKADFIGITIAQTPETEHLFDAAAFAACKPNAFLTNIGRGGTIDQAALLDALVSGKIAGAGTDVTDPEPLPPDDPLWDAPNLIITPHCAGGTSPWSQQRLAERVIENLAKFLNGTLVPT
jgi:phosphoglycerate dehydrogenase-like enzyme